MQKYSSQLARSAENFVLFVLKMGYIGKECHENKENRSNYTKTGMFLGIHFPYVGVAFGQNICP